jgi:hypothetical protein
MRKGNPAARIVFGRSVEKTVRLRRLAAVTKPEPR